MGDEIKGIQVGKEEVTLSSLLFADGKTFT